MARRVLLALAAIVALVATFWVIPGTGSSPVAEAASACPGKIGWPKVTNPANPGSIQSYVHATCGSGKVGVKACVETQKGGKWKQITCKTVAPKSKSTSVKTTAKTVCGSQKYRTRAIFSVVSGGDTEGREWMSKVVTIKGKPC